MLKVVTPEMILSRGQDEKALPERVQNMMMQRVMQLREGAVFTVAMECKGFERCPYGSRCPYKVQEGLEPPIGETCPLEEYLSALWYEEYITEYEVKFGKRTEEQLVATLVMIDVELSRANAKIARDGMEQLVITEFEEGGKKIDTKLHTLYAHINNLHVRRDRIIETLSKKKSSKANLSPADYIETIMKNVNKNRGL